METIKIRIELLKQMHKYILDTGDEDIYDVWFMEGVPDEPSEDDYEFIATHSEEFLEVVNLFDRLTRKDIRENY